MLSACHCTATREAAVGRLDRLDRAVRRPADDRAARCRARRRPGGERSSRARRSRRGRRRRGCRPAGARRASRPSRPPSGGAGSSDGRWLGRSCTSVPPRETLSTCSPRQIARTGSSRASAARTRAISKLSRCGSVGPSSGVRLGAVDRRVQVRPARQAQAAEAVEQRLDAVDVQRRDDDRHGAGAADRLRVGEAERELLLGRLAVGVVVDAGRLAHLRRAQADDRVRRARRPGSGSGSGRGGSRKVVILKPRRLYPPPRRPRQVTASKPRPLGTGPDGGRACVRRSRSG